VPHHLRPADQRGSLQQVQRRALSTGRRLRGHHQLAARGVRDGNRPVARLLSEPPPAPRGRRHRWTRRRAGADPQPSRGHEVMIKLKAPEEIEIMRAASVIVAEVLAELKAMVRPGITTEDLDRVAEDLTRKKGAVPAFKGYEVANRVFPASLCVSINDEVVHG